jgi:hypothetical protein
MISTKLWVGLSAIPIAYKYGQGSDRPFGLYHSFHWAIGGLWIVGIAFTTAWTIWTGLKLSREN